MPASRRSRSPKSARPPLARTAFVLAGGGSLGAIQVGMLKALARAGIVPDLVVGASVGAINGAFFAARPDVAGARALERIWSRMRRAVVFPFSPVNSVLSLLGLRDHFVSPAGLRALIRLALPYRRLEQARVPCHFVATDLLSGAEYVMSDGPALPALMASAAIPGLYPPVSYRRRHLVDGGVADNTPISTAIALGATRLIVLPTGLSCDLKRPPRAAAALAVHALNLLIMRQLLDDLRRFESRAELVTLPPPCPVRVSAYDFSQSSQLIRRAEADARRYLRRFGATATGAPETLLPHAH